MTKFLVFNCLTALLFIRSVSFAQTESFEEQVKNLAKNIKGTVGVTVMKVEEKQHFSWNGDKHFPMQSVFKFPIAMAVLHEIDSGNCSLDKMIHVAKEDMYKTYSPLRDKYPEGNIDVSIRDLLVYMVSLSDNNACDILLEKVVSVSKTETFLRKLGIKGIQIKASEKEMGKDWNVQYTNWTQPVEMGRLLEIVFREKALSKSSNTFLLKIMTETPTGLKRIKGLLPEGTSLAHKTGTSSTNSEGITAAVNDVGIVTLPNGKHLIICIFIMNANERAEGIEPTIAAIAKAAFDWGMK
ncbi:beta-lactamase class A [Pseudarcicella hirudinis]|uniref:Beta-lactamase n=1 Tax=Pseudarcicella hirudinis TaxID=1079859 RepID=A0A1I5TJU2_9BACT|nr:class A beta-lactamase, subclass A2 [Pseudarcicella hirudinis]SFP83131.1 beta-lactamase class A [Pseudarcicella hirudinis]